MTKDKAILVTGATGFVGSYLLRYLIGLGYTNLRALRRQNSPADLIREVGDKVSWFEGDVLDMPSLEVAMAGVKQVYHAAAVLSFNHSDYKTMREVNEEGTANIVNLALEEGIEKLVHVSSIAALGRRTDGQHLSEKSKWEAGNLNSGYAVSKHLAEMQVWRGIAEGLPAAIVNPANVLGSGFWRGRTGTGQLFYKTWKGLPFYPRGGSGFVDVRDVARFMVQLMESGAKDERFVLNGENLPFKTVFGEIAKSLNVKGPGVEVTPVIRELAWRGAWLFSKFTGKQPFITKDTARASARTFFYDNSKSLQAFPFVYTPISQTIRETGRQFLESVGKGFQPAVLPF